MDNENVSVQEIENLAKLFHRVLPIQSFRQLVSVGVAAVLVSLGFFGIFRILPPTGVVVGMLLGMYPFLAGALPTRLRIEIVGRPLLKRELMEGLEEAAFRFGYKAKDIVEGVVTLKPRLPRILVWDENTVRLAEQQDAIIVVGPLLATSLLRRKALRQVAS